MKEYQERSESLGHRAFCSKEAISTASIYNMLCPDLESQAGVQAQRLRSCKGSAPSQMRSRNTCEWMDWDILTRMIAVSSSLVQEYFGKPYRGR